MSGQQQPEIPDADFVWNEHVVPLLEPTRTALYDTAIVHDRGAGKSDLSFFQSALGSPRVIDFDYGNGESSHPVCLTNMEFGAKDFCDTNMHLSGCLPTPHRFELHGILIVPDLRGVAMSDRRYVRDFIEEAIRYASYVRLYLGCKHYIEIPTACAISNLVLNDETLDHIEKFTHTKMARAYDPRLAVPLEQAHRVYLTIDELSAREIPPYLVGKVKEGKLPIHIPSQQSMWVAIHFPDGLPKTKVKFGLKCYLTGVHYREVM